MDKICYIYKIKLFFLSKSNKKSALSEIHGVEQPETISRIVAHQIQQFRRKQPSAEELISGILKGDKTALSRAITLVESTNPEHLEKASHRNYWCSRCRKEYIY
jgi:LAO/AO transport system kinase